MSTNTGVSDTMKAYFSSLERGLEVCMDIAMKARAKGLDPSLEVEIPVAEDLASRVEKLVGPPGVAEIIRTESKGKNREEVSLLVARKIALEFKGEKCKALDQAIRTGLAILTEGVLVAPLEGIADVKIGKNSDGTEYADVYFAGPIRSAGGTGQALSVLIADMVKSALGLSRYNPTEKEVERYKEEFGMYKSLQYQPTNEEIELVVRSCPVCINGEGTEKEEVTGNRDLQRVETNQVRGGVCLVIAEGLCLKAAKVNKHVKKLDIKGWDFIDRFLKKEKKDDGPKKDEEEETMDCLEGYSAPPAGATEPKLKYIEEILAGRPVFGHPSVPGNFRLRLGRGRNTGLAAIAINPAAMYIVDEFIAVGTQVKIERPGKAGALGPCDSIEGPLVQLTDGTVTQINDVRTAKALHSQVTEIIDLGEVLIPFGEFSENNHTLIPGSYSKEGWWLEYLASGGKDEKDFFPNARRAVEISRALKLPLCPDFNLYWHDLSPVEIEMLAGYLSGKGRYKADLGLDESVNVPKGLKTIPVTRDLSFPIRKYNQELAIPSDPKIKDILKVLGVEHTIRGSDLVITRYAYPLIICLGLSEDLHRIRMPADYTLDLDRQKRAVNPKERFQMLKLLEYLAGIPVRARSPTRIGSRMGRPEKANLRKMKPPVHALFPIAQSGSAQRLLRKAADNATIEVDIGARWCPKCGTQRHLISCEKCGTHTRDTLPNGESEILKWNMPVGELMEAAKKRLKLAQIPEVKAVQGLISKNKTAEPLEKGMLRAKNDVFVFKDGTCRFDLTDLTLTHFRPKEIGLDVGGARGLGYTKDIYAQDLTRDDQILELKPQDVVVAGSCGEYFVHVANFLDELLVRFYGLDPFYNAKKKEDLIGHMTIGLAPHTSGGVLCRIIGYVTAAVGYGHPYFHCAKRRNCDGDEDALLLLLDGLLNFSRAFIPKKRGGLMDAPLVLSSRIDPNEIDKEAQNIDCLPQYPLDYYKATMAYKAAKDVEKFMDMVGGRIGKTNQYEGIMFTHDTVDISEGPKASAYKTLGSMEEKMNAQLDLGRKIRAVDESDEAAKVIETHFLPDMVGNLKSFSRQELRCTKCSTKYRRVPLTGRCIKMLSGADGEHRCDNNLTMTVSEGSVKKYLEVTKKIAVKYHVNPYVYQRVLMTEIAINSLFTENRVKKMKLDDFL